MKKYMNGKYYDVYTKETFSENIGSSYNNIAIIDNQGVVLPIRNCNEKGPGYYPTGMNMSGVSMYVKIEPTQDEINDTYNSKDNFIDFNDTDTLTQYMINIDKERQLTENIISNVENEYKPTIRKNDDPFMQLVKEAIHQKHFDISKYKEIFGVNFNNDKRSLESSSITLNKANEILTKLGIEISIGLRNANSNIPNPMRNEVSGVINSPDFKVNIGPIQPDDVVVHPSSGKYEDSDEKWDGDD